MTTLRQAAQQALEALGKINKLSVGENAICLPAEIDGAMDALRAAIEQAQRNEFNPDCDAMAVMVEEQQRMAKRIAELEAQPVQEPVAWAVYDIKHGGSKTLHWPEQHSPNGDPSQFKAVPLYTAPPQRPAEPVQEPVGAVLVNRESREGVMFYSVDMIPDPSTLKDRFELVPVYTAPPPRPAEPVQEPVAHKHEWFSTGAMESGKMRCIHCGIWNHEAAPPQRKPLTDKEIDYWIGSNSTKKALARAIEAAHGIKENT